MLKREVKSFTEHTSSQVTLWCWSWALLPIIKLYNMLSWKGPTRNLYFFFCFIFTHWTIGIGTVSYVKELLGSTPWEFVLNVCVFFKVTYIIYIFISLSFGASIIHFLKSFAYEVTNTWHLVKVNYMDSQL